MEVNAYTRLNPIHHEHIIRLLATYQHVGQLHMIFPWASCNLLEYWDQEPRRGEPLAKWLIGQFLGLSQALVCIHDMTSSANDPEGKKKKHGRHGDLKPQNILWFEHGSDAESVESFGTLKISDLGSTEFHDTASQNVRASKVGPFTDTYKAPEFDMMKEVTPRADIWSLGCILMEFLVWYTIGKQGVSRFASSRSEDTMLMYASDHFFNYDLRYGTVNIKQSVAEVCDSICIMKLIVAKQR